MVTEGSKYHGSDHLPDSTNSPTFKVICRSNPGKLLTNIKQHSHHLSHLMRSHVK